MKQCHSVTVNNKCVPLPGGKSWNNSVPSIWLDSGYTGVDNTYPRQQAKQIMMANEYS